MADKKPIKSDPGVKIVNNNPVEYNAGGSNTTKNMINNTLQLEVDLLIKDQDSDPYNYKAAVLSLGVGILGTFVRDMNPVDRNSLLCVVADYRNFKREQRLKAWVENSAKTIQPQNVFQAKQVSLVKKEPYEPQIPRPWISSGGQNNNGHERFLKKYFGELLKNT